MVSWLQLVVGPGVDAVNDDSLGVSGQSKEIHQLAQGSTCRDGHTLWTFSHARREPFDDDRQCFPSSHGIGVIGQVLRTWRPTVPV